VTLETGCKDRKMRQKIDGISSEKEGGLGENKKALCGNRRPSNDCLPYEKSLKDRCLFLVSGTKIKTEKASE
jgi:hypothetical protein